MPDNLGPGPRIIAVGGAKGGVGRTLVATGVAIFVAQLGKRALLVDATTQATCLGRVLGATPSETPRDLWAPAPYDPRGVETAVPKLRLLEASSELGPRPDVTLRAPRELCRSSGADVCVLDLAPSLSGHTLDALFDSDAQVLVTTPEPGALEALYRLLRHGYARKLAQRLREDACTHALELLQATVRNRLGPPAPVQLAEVLAAQSEDVGAVAWAELQRLRPRLVVNQSRSRADLELGDAVVRVAARVLGVQLENLGPIEFDDAVPLAARRRKPLLLDAPAAKASRNLERIARKVLTVDPSRSSPTLSGVAPPTPTHYDILVLDRGASDEELRRAYRKTREVWSSESLCLSGLVTEAQVSAMVARIEEARDVLLDPSRRRPYDLSITPASELRALAFLSEPAAESAPAAEVPMPVLTPDTDYTGPLLRAVREARGIELRDVAARTRISPVYLRAIEEEDYNILPATVYTRGFVIEVAKLLRLDPELVVRSYLKRMRRPEAR
jgi:flagellar biosynthesis protein FlhG